MSIAVCFFPTTVLTLFVFNAILDMKSNFVYSFFTMMYIANISIELFTVHHSFVSAI